MKSCQIGLDRLALPDLEIAKVVRPSAWPAAPDGTRDAGRGGAGTPGLGGTLPGETTVWLSG